ncbi:SRPBCC domain-containing protein [Streptomyces amakusaensis]|uniref:SRPBCC family protein n=1 Tax=Streptomyces amakusaensis TaxID=67271 RepID=A0ABW0AW65_9ACTN
MGEDRIDREIGISAPVERVWAVLTEGEHVGKWFGQGEPVRVELWPGGTMLLDHGEYGRFPTTVVAVDPPRRLSYRWASGHPGEQAAEGNSTLVEYILTAEGEGTRLRITESGFASVDVPEEHRAQASYESHDGGWAGQLVNIRDYAEARGDR